MATIFLVDDSRLHLNVLSRTLEERTYDIRTFELAKDLLAAMKEQTPDLIVSDIVMPEMDGVQLVAEIRKTYPKEELPILLVSSLDTMEDMVRGYEAGADDYLVKPVRTPEFHAKVSLLLRQRRARPAPQPSDKDQASGGRERPSGSRLVDRYEILKLLGEGAFGVVHKARRLGCDDVIALKVLSQAKLSKRSVARFLRETEVLKALDKVEGISRIVDVGFDGENYFYAMELVEGRSIRDILDSEGALSELVSLKVARGIAEILKVLDRNEIVHRDIKPGNIILSSNETATLIDFGLAREVESARVTGKHELPGTPAYIPPEAIRGEPFDIRGDIYSLGVTLFEMLTNRLPFEATSGLFMLVNVADGQAPDMDPLIDADVSPAFAAIVERMIANTPEDRYESPEELIEDLLEAV